MKDVAEEEMSRFRIGNNCGRQINIFVPQNAKSDSARRSATDPREQSSDIEDKIM